MGSIRNYYDQSRINSMAEYTWYGGRRYHRATNAPTASTRAVAPLPAASRQSIAFPRPTHFDEQPTPPYFSSPDALDPRLDRRYEDYPPLTNPFARGASYEMAPFVEQLTPPLALPLNAGHTMNNHDHPGPLQYHSAPYYRPPPHHEDVVTPPEYWDQSSVTPTRHQPYATNTEPNRSHVDWTPTLSTAYPPPEQPAAATFPYRGAQMDGPHSAATARRYEHPYRGAQMDGSHSAASTRRYEHKMKRRREKDHTATLNHPQPMSLLNSRPPHKVYSVYRRAKSHVTECYCFLPDYDFCPRHPDVVQHAPFRH